MAESLRSLLPEVCRPWLPSFFDAPALVEPRTTCLDCAMCGDKGRESVAAHRTLEVFRPDIKCCTWEPELPNYLAGAALRDTSLALADGRARLRAKIKSRVGVTPLQLAPPPRFGILYAFLVKEEPAEQTSFGQAEELVCPYFGRDSGLCTIWPFRERVCSTWFCKIDEGAAGFAAWQAIKDYLGHVEVEISRYAAARVLGFPPLPPRAPSTRPLSAEELAGHVPEEEYARAWGRYVGREEELYRTCAEIVAALRPSDVHAMLDGGKGRELLAKAVVRYEDIAYPKLAPKLVLRTDRTTAPIPDGMRVWTFSRFDPSVVPHSLYALLERFSPDETTLENLARLGGENSELTEALLLRLQLEGVMAPP